MSKNLPLTYKKRNVKKGILDKIDSEMKNQDSRSKNIWNSWKDKYSKKQPNCPFEDLLRSDE